MYTEIKTFEDACKALGVKAKLPTLKEAPAQHLKALLAHYQLVLIAEAINEGWKPNWKDSDERKWQLWPDIVTNKKSASGFGLSYGVCDDWLTATTVGSRLCFKTREQAKHCFDTFKQLWEDYFLIDK